MKTGLDVAALISCVLVLFFLTWFPAFPACAAGDSVKIDPALQRAVDRDGSTGYIIHFRSRPNLLSARTMEWNDRGRFVANPSGRAGYGGLTRPVTAKAGKIVTSSFRLPAPVIKGPKILMTPSPSR